MNQKTGINHPDSLKYQDRRDFYLKESKDYSKKINRTSNLRLVTTILGLTLSILAFIHINLLTSSIVFAAFLICFVYLVIKHRRYTENKNYTLALARINEESLTRLKGEWNTFSDKGEEFIDEDHQYSQDLNIFGQGSLFQWINTTTTFTGRLWLSKILTEPMEEIESIHKRQNAIKELAKELPWRQNLIAEGRKIDIDAKNRYPAKDPASLFNWAKNSKDFYLKSWVIAGINILPVITISLILVSILTQISNFFPILMILFQIIILTVGYSSRVEDFTVTAAYKDLLTSYKNMLLSIEGKEFNSKLLKDLQGSLINPNGNSKASHNLSKFEQIVDTLSNRYIQFYLIFNILFLLDYRWQISLEKWKQESGKKLETWFEVIGQIEALASVSIISWDNPDWVLPEITSKPKIFEAKELGHPLLTKQRISNDVKIKPPVNILLITGSNMSGKSTLLRTTGLNLVLAYMGVPVCASSFKASLMKIYTCMQVSDNLEKNISSFYAELLRIKQIIQTAEKTNVFFLLDEIFKGTNSKDRHIGARAVIKKLQQEGGLGLVSTHDLELGDLAKENSGVNNYHFREYYQNDQIKFDYVLREGLSPTRNAIYLMKLAGIRPEEAGEE